MRKVLLINYFILFSFLAYAGGDWATSAVNITLNGGTAYKYRLNDAGWTNGDWGTNNFWGGRNLGTVTSLVLNGGHGNAWASTPDYYTGESFKMYYRVYLSSNSGGSWNSISLDALTYNVDNNRIYDKVNANIDILGLVGNQPGTYKLEIVMSKNQFYNEDNWNSMIPGGQGTEYNASNAGYIATFTISGWRFEDKFRSYVGIDFNGDVSTYSLWDSGIGNFQGANLGTFTDKTQTFAINLWDVKTWKGGDGDVTGAAINYRIYKQGSTPPSFTNISGHWIENLAEAGVQKWGRTFDPDGATAINISGLDNSSTYVLEIYIEATGTSPTEIKYDNNSGDNYKATFTTNAAFPVELTSFSAKQNGNNVTLNWKTATEVNNYGFEVQKSSDNSTWNKIGFVQGAGNSNSPKEYSYTDKLSNLNGKFYYRLKQMDNDGTISYSKVVEVENLKPSVFNLSQNYPNPFNPSTVIKYQIPVDSRVSVKVYNVLGNVVATLQNGFQTAGEYSVTLDGSNLASGVYFYKIEAGEFTATKKMLLTK